jgi:ADP-L-glycero-D-manno-heptose 6-epimerase
MIVVTGSSGFIGSNLVERLSNEGHSVLCVDFVQRNYINKLKNVSILIAEDFYERLDLYYTRFKFHTIFHEGAISSTTETDWKKLFEKNVNPSLNLIYFCRNKGIKLQYASSASVYGNLSKKEWQKENKNTNPLNLYAKSKAQIDNISNMIIDCKKPPILLQGMRYFNVFGKNEDHKEDQSSPHHKFTRQLKETGKIRLFEGSKNFYRDFVSVDEIIDKKIYCLNNKPSGIYDVGTSKPKSFYEVAIEICKDENLIEWIPMPDNLKEHYQSYSYANMKWYTNDFK